MYNSLIPTRGVDQAANHPLTDLPHPRRRLPRPLEMHPNLRNPLQLLRRGRLPHYPSVLLPRLRGPLPGFL
jgi:hypothetical protein